MLQGDAQRIDRISFDSFLIFVVSVLGAIIYRFFRRDALGRPKSRGRLESEASFFSFFCCAAVSGLCTIDAGVTTMYFRASCAFIFRDAICVVVS
jgi:hypothetical protein